MLIFAPNSFSASLYT